MHYPATELVLDKNGNVYHLGVSPEDIADKIILVGDQDRVDLVAALFDTVEHASQHREFVCKTGVYLNKRISVLSTGIGTDNIDIVINELDALVNIDLKERTDKSNFKSLDLVRIGTCGILQEDIPIHSYILSTHAFGLDNVAHFYDIPFTESEEQLKNEIMAQVDFPELVKPYLIEASKTLQDKMSSEKTTNGITITSSGFYGPQGRQLRLKNKVSGINEQLTAFRNGTNRILNFEMESSALFALGKSLGHNCATLCLGIANRPNKEFSTGHKDDMVKLIKYVLDRI
ncbi:MAG: nucleoside phosphorylase [Crocinitomicaceae bacterium]|nr:nucleoside phosphorylase [Crocinitomicaceae bacterium]MDG1776355.1 nucleoside phosphorylase [Crocinitomicaceae bacterium]